MLFRLLIGAGLFGTGFYLGREMGRTESLRNRLEHDARSTRVQGTVLDFTDERVVNITRNPGTESRPETGNG